MIEVVVEIPRGSRNKYEYDEAVDVYRLDRVLASAVHYNFGYGFVVGTRADDGDHTDALLLIDEPTFPGCHAQAEVDNLDDVKPHRLVEIENFFATYKLLEDKAVVVVGWCDQERAREALGADRAAWDREVAGRSASG